jgi:hypothetical protein
VVEEQLAVALLAPLHLLIRVLAAVLVKLLAVEELVVLRKNEY